MSLITVRMARPDDVEAIADLNAQAWKVGFRGVVPDDHLAGRTGSPKEVPALAEPPAADSIQFVAVGVDDVPVGWLVAKPAAEPDLDNSMTYEIGACYTHPDHWRRGIARLMVEHLWGYLTDAQWKQIILWTPRDSDRSRGFYESMGFVADGTEKEADYGGPVALVRYIRSY